MSISISNLLVETWLGKLWRKFLKRPPDWALDLKSRPELDSELLEIACFLAGNYNSFSQNERDVSQGLTGFSLHERVCLHLVPFTSCELSQFGHALYLEQAYEEDPENPYRQRVNLVARRTDGRAVTRVFQIDSARQFIGAHRNSAVLSELTVQRLTASVGCDVVWTRGTDGYFHGLAGACGSCKTNYGGATHVVVTSKLTGSELFTLDQGLNDEGRLIFGPTAEEGPYEFRKQDF